MLTEAILHLHPLALGALAAILIAGGASKGALGIGLPLLAVPLAAQMLDLPAVIALLAVPVLMANVVQALEGGGIAPALRRLWPVVGAIVLGTWAGVHLLISIERRPLDATVGTALVLTAALLLAQPQVRLGHQAERWAGPFVGLFAGLLGGMSGMFGPPLIVFLVGLGLSADAFVKHISILFLASSATLLLTLGGTGTMSPVDFVVSCAAMLPIQIGILIGRWLRGRCPPSLFRVLVLCVLLLGGLNMLRRALF